MIGPEERPRVKLRLTFLCADCEVEIPAGLRRCDPCELAREREEEARRPVCPGCGERFAVWWLARGEPEPGQVAPFCGGCEAKAGNYGVDGPECGGFDGRATGRQLKTAGDALCCLNREIKRQKNDHRSLRRG